MCSYSAVSRVLPGFLRKCFGAVEQEEGHLTWKPSVQIPERRPMINQPPPLTSLHVRIHIIIPVKGEGG